ncbi:hypothetical protein Trydic_g16133 [Trypoxylus dichotomus]
MSKFIILVSFMAACATELPTQSLADQGNDHAGSFRIAGGIAVEDRAYPFMVSLRHLPNEHFCGGSIISKQWVLTAAQCMFGQTVSRVKVVAGTNKLDSGGTAVGIQRVIIHPEYGNTSEKPNDIALIRLVSALTYSISIGQIPINTNKFDSYTTVTAIGWGSTKRDGPLSNKLLQYSTQTIPQTTCRGYWRRLTENQICTTFAPQKGICRGDSGGPLIDAKSKTQVGIASVHCSRRYSRTYPDVYTRISEYVLWINSTLSARS